MQGDRALGCIRLACAILLSLTAAATAQPLPSEPGYRLQQAELWAVTDALRLALWNQETARLSDVVARQAPPPSRAVNVCGFIEIRSHSGALGKYPFMASLARPDTTGGVRATIGGVGDPEDIARSYTTCKVCEESALPICP